MSKGTIAICFSLMACLANATALRAGVSKVDITPAPGELMWGFESRTTPAKGTLDPLYARVLVLESGAQRLGLVTLDLGRSFGPAATEEIRESAQRTSAITCLLLSASHTHSAPGVQDTYKKGVPPWERAAREKIKEAIRDATAHLTDARIGTGVGIAYIGHNRLRVDANGKVGWFERNPTQIPTAPVDPTVTVVRVDALDGKPLAIVVNYACHPVVFGEDNLQYSADYPAAMNRVVEQTTGAMSFFLQGAPGDINPYYTQQPIEQDAQKMREWTGERLGKEAARVAQGIRTEAGGDSSIQSSEELVKFRLRWDPQQFQAALLKFLGPEALEGYIDPTAREFSIPVSTVLINKQIAITTFPGEPFVEFQMNWRDRCPVGTTLLAGYTNGYYGYFPTIASAARGGYGAASAATWMEPGAGEWIIDRAVVNILKMLGRLADMPDDLKGNVYKP
ncbi:MAG TPA: neutral/alkaline non-lysosomal ceramidase N-terminal domain-containing protein [Bryobacteraceae bacterium]|nr:neutral/alkaline non-lysosomal ceramidase N-terminal domain-containing protein [Bryobacteraceae bacterium]